MSKHTIKSKQNQRRRKITKNVQSKRRKEMIYAVSGSECLREMISMAFSNDFIRFFEN